MPQAPPENTGNPTAAVLVIGNEILSGRTQDKNTQYIAQKLIERGMKLIEARVVPDVESRIVAAVNELRTACDYVFTTGGIGPTHDDITADSIAKAVGRPVETNAQAYKILEEYYGAEELTPARARMARMPEGAALVPNPVSAAPGFIVENIYVMAGVPAIMQAMMDYIVPGLAGGQPLLSRTVMSDLAESVIAGAVGAVQEKYSAIDIGSYPHFSEGKLGLSIVLRGTEEALLEKATAEVLQLVANYGGPGET